MGIMLIETRQSTLLEIDAQLRSYRQDPAASRNPMQYIKITRLESERNWILQHTPGLRPPRPVA
jgi:hypothetical protein